MYNKKKQTIRKFRSSMQTIIFKIFLIAVFVGIFIGILTYQAIEYDIPQGAFILLMVLFPFIILTLLGMFLYSFVSVKVTAEGVCQSLFGIFFVRKIKVNEIFDILVVAIKEHDRDLANIIYSEKLVNIIFSKNIVPNESGEDITDIRRHGVFSAMWKFKTIRKSGLTKEEIKDNQLLQEDINDIKRIDCYFKKKEIKIVGDILKIEVRKHQNLQQKCENENFAASENH